MHNLNAGVAGEPTLIESKNAGEAMHLHGGDRSGVMSRFSDNPVLNNKVLPCRINRGSVGQQRKHAFQPNQFYDRFVGRHSQAVLRHRPGCHNPHLEEILWNDVDPIASVGQRFKSMRNRFILRMAHLQSS